jgi:hypothetical protein
MSALSTYRGGSIPTQKTQRLWMSVVMVLAMALASISVVAAQAQAGSFDQRPPKEVMFKGTQVHREGKMHYYYWHYYETGNWAYDQYGYDGTYEWPRADVVMAGSRLRIRISKPQRPDSFRIEAYPRLFNTGEGIPYWDEEQRLKYSFSRVERDGKTVAWNVYFRVNEADRHYYLVVYGRWASVPDTHISYGRSWTLFHLRTS